MNETWRDDPLLKGKFHPDCPDDIQVLIHAGNPRFSGKRNEVAWVRVTQTRGQCYVGTLLNQPKQLDNLRQGDEVLFMAVQSAPYPFLVDPDYVEDRKNWVISPCAKCGFTEMFQPPTKRIEAFKQGTKAPDEPRTIMLSTFCPLCGGHQMLGKVGTAGEEKVRAYNPFSKNKWWQFWKR